jgi:MFS family permease
MLPACVVATRAMMLRIALLVGRTADSWGRKPLLLAGFAILPVRAVLYTLSDNSFWLVSVQVLDGVGEGIFGALTPWRSPTSCEAAGATTTGAKPPPRPKYA